MKNIVIIGLGLIGGSLAKVIRKGRFPVYITACDTNEEYLRLAQEQGVIDEYTHNLESCVSKADLIILSVPIYSALRLLKIILDLPLKSGCIITDVGSTKKEILDLVIDIRPKDVFFIGGHPMAGSHKSGFLASDASLFENAYYILTPATEQDLVAMDYLMELLEASRAKFYIMDSEYHDRMAGVLSHLPHIVAAGLVNEAEAFIFDYPQAKRLAAGGFRDITRISSSDPKMWTQILMSNKPVLLPLLESFQVQLEHVKKALEEGAEDSIFDYFLSAKTSRDDLPTQERGAIESFFDLLVNIPDEVGVLALVLQLLADVNISVVNLRIIEMREDIQGVLQISFKNMKDLLRAKEYLEEKTDYHCVIK